MTIYIDIHAIQDVPPSNLNRDDAGEPKTATYGGVTRSRVSSQSWKRATRAYFTEILDSSQIGIRTLQVVELLAKEITQQDPSLQDEAQALAENVFKAAKIKTTPPRKKPAEGENEPANVSQYLIFLSPGQISNLAKEAISAKHEDRKLVARTIKEIFNNKNAVDIALFGRMIAENPDLNVDASCQVAHAISTHAAETEYDFFTAVDDAKASAEDTDAGAGMMGTVGFSSSTLYRYATVNFDMLSQNLGSTKAALEALGTFLEAFTRSMPTGKQNTFANRTLPNTVVASIRDDQPISLVSAFEQAVPARAGEGFTARSVAALAAEKSRIEDAFDAAPLHSYVVSVQDPTTIENFERLGKEVSLKGLVSSVTSAVTNIVESV